jgi:hypothetical protein
LLNAFQFRWNLKEQLMEMHVGQPPYVPMMYRVGQKCLTNFKIQLKSYKFPEKNVKLILFDGYIHKVFYTLSALKYGHSVSHGEHPDEITIVPMCEPACLC